MEKESDNDIKPKNEEEEGNHPKPDSDDTAAVTAAEPLYFNKDGKLLVGITAPTAYVVSYPYPPLPSNLGKNRVLRVSDEQTKESVKEGIAEAEKDIEKEAMPLPGLTLQGSPLPKVLVPEIELALYWDRHPYEFRPSPVKDQDNKTTPKSDKAIRRSKSEINLASKVGKLLEEYSNPDKSIKGSSGRSSSISGANKAIRSSSVTTASSLKSGKSMELLSPKKSHYGEHSTFPIKYNGSVDISIENRCVNGKCGSGVSSAKSSVVDGNRISGGDNGVKVGNGDGPSANKSALQLSENERKKFEDIKLFHRQNEREVYGQGSHSRQPKLIRSHDQMEQNVKKTAGVQVTIDDASAAAMKSTYLCPLHGQYRRGIERRDKGGFRTDMGINNVHANCSRALKGKPTRTKMIKTVETQTEQESGPFQNIDAQFSKRSRTAGHTRSSQKGRDVMASEYHGSFKNPYKIAESEKRHLRNKILNYCFTKHSIF